MSGLRKYMKPWRQDYVVMTNRLRCLSKKIDLFNRTVAAISIGAMALVNTLVPSSNLPTGSNNQDDSLSLSLLTPGALSASSLSLVTTVIPTGGDSSSLARWEGGAIVGYFLTPIPDNAVVKSLRRPWKDNIK